MAETNELMLSILKDVQANLADVKAAVEHHTTRFDLLDEQIEAMSGYVTYAIGKSSENRVDLETLREDIKSLKARVTALESAE